MGIVVSVHRVAERDGAAVPLDVATVVADVGLEGDWRSRPGRRRQITIIEAEALEAVATALGRPVAAGASRRQVVVRGLPLNPMIGKRLRLGSVLVQIDEVCDPCENMDRTIGPRARQAMEGRGGVCGRVLEGGCLRPGDAVSVEE
jgi:MOSC domain-containing protein YiiM